MFGIVYIQMELHRKCLELLTIEIVMLLIHLRCEREHMLLFEIGQKRVIGIVCIQMELHKKCHESFLLLLVLMVLCHLRCEREHILL